MASRRSPELFASQDCSVFFFVSQDCSVLDQLKLVGNSHGHQASRYSMVQVSAYILGKKTRKYS